MGERETSKFLTINNGNMKWVLLALGLLGGGSGAFGMSGLKLGGADADEEIVKIEVQKELRLLSIESSMKEVSKAQVVQSAEQERQGRLLSRIAGKLRVRDAD